MRSLSAARRVIPAVAAAAVCALAVPAAAVGAGLPAAITLPEHAAAPGQQIVHDPLLVKVRGRAADGSSVTATASPGGYTATELRAYLNLSGTGAGQTVAIVDAYDDPYAASDITTYSQQFGLPLPCTAKQEKNQKKQQGCFSFQVVAPYGVGGLDTGWVLEESLDVDMVHAIAPDAAIVLVEAHDNSNTAMLSALGYAGGLGAAVISNSWTFGGEFAGETSDDSYCQLSSAVCVFSTGDTGNPGGYPAYSPDVIAVGGTSLQLTSTGAVTSEAAWDGSGGGVSADEPRPAYQDAVNPEQGRGIPDVSFDADPSTGVAVYSAADGGWLEVGGTSVGAPAWSGILAAADQLRSAAGKSPLTAAGDEAQLALYQLSTGLSDVTSGTNGSCGAICTAGPGYDFVTGLGSPRPGIDTALAAAS
jgi:subtilase family serine protease